MIWASLLIACVSSTGGERIDFSVSVDPVAPVTDTAQGPRILYTDPGTGWNVSLDRAEVLVGPAYAWSDRPLARRWSWSLIRTAHAQDYYEAGFLVAEYTFQQPVDLLAGSVEIGLGDGVAGVSRSAEVWLEPDLDGKRPTLTVRGEAELAGSVVPFIGEITWDGTWVDEDRFNPVTIRRVRGIPWDVELTADGNWTIGIDATKFLDGADFSTLVGGPTDPDGYFIIEPDTPVGQILYTRPRRTGSTGPWRLSYN